MNLTIWSSTHFLILESPNSAKPKSAAVTVNANKRVRKPSWKSLSFEESNQQGAHLAQSPPPTNPWKTLPPPEQPAQLQNILQVIFANLSDAKVLKILKTQGHFAS